MSANNITLKCDIAFSLCPYMQKMHNEKTETMWDIIFNSSYFDDIFKDSGFAELANQYGPWFTHSGSPRAKIFARDQNKIVDTDSITYVMRYVLIVYM